MADKLGSLRVVEFYSGIGGMHYAVKECGASIEVVAALEINTTANQVYKFNFGGTSLLQKNIEGLTIQDVDSLSADVFLMSPPCQPFTRVGLQGASGDPRTKSFLHILDLLPKLHHPPDFILMENVKGFETSDTRIHFVETLKSCDYSFQELLLSPNQFGVPNSRLRYYLLAKKKPLQFYFPPRDEVMESIPSRHDTEWCYQGHSNSRTGYQSHASQDGQQTTLRYVPNGMLANNGESLIAESNMDAFQGDEHRTICLDCIRNRAAFKETSQTEGCVHDRTPQGCGKPAKCRTVGEFLEKQKDDKYFEDFLLPEKVLSKFALLLDIVGPQSDHSCCFTKAYGHYAEGTGSVLKMVNVDDTEIFNRYRRLTDGKEKSQLLSVLKLRYFSPREVANLHGFPTEFDFPASLSVKQQYRLLGNSLNVRVVAELLNCLFQSSG